MSKNNIDSKVVEMQFDNKNFESNVQTSLGTLDKLKKALNFDGATKGMEELDKASRKLDFGTFGDAVDEVKVKFTALEGIALGVLQSIGAEVYQTGKRIVSSLTIDQIREGWDKFATKTEAVQTIMSATTTTWQQNAEAIGFAGSQMEFVNGQLERLNWFSDETSFSFTDMTDNIGKFTAAGVDLTDATEAMMGISAWAAKSGVGIQQASRAMYNLSQVLGAGQMNLIDWKSIELANMATYEFKETLIQTALAMGRLKEASDAPEGTYEIANPKNKKNYFVNPENLRETLSEGWFDSEVLMAVLQEYGKASSLLAEFSDEYDVTATSFLSNLEDYQNGEITLDQMAHRFQMSVEDLDPYIQKLTSDEYALSLASFKAAQEALTFKQAVEATADAVSTQWMTTFELIFGDYEEAKAWWTDITELMWEIFASSGDVRNQILNIWNAAGGAEDLKEAFWNVVDIIETIVGKIKNAYYKIFYGVEDAYDGLTLKIENSANKLIAFTSKLREVTEQVDLFLKKGKNTVRLRQGFEGIFRFLNLIKNIIGAVAKGFSIIFGSAKKATSGFGDTLLDGVAALGEFLNGIVDSAEEMEIFETITNTVVNVLNKLVDAFKIVIGFFIKVKDSCVAFKNVGSDISKVWSRVGGYIEKGLRDPAKNIASGIVNTLEIITNSVIEFFALLTGSDLTKVQNKVTKVFQDLNTTLFNFIDACKEFGTQIDESFQAVTGKTISEAFDTLKTSVQEAYQSVKDFFEGFSDVDFTSFDSIKGKIEETFHPVTDTLTGVGKVLDWLKEKFAWVGTVLGLVFKGIGDSLKGVKDNFTNDDGTMDTDSVLGLLAGGGLIAIIIGIKKLIDKIKEPVNSIKDSVVGVLDSVRECFEQWQNNLKAKVLKDIGIGIGIVAAAMIILCLIPSEKLLLSLTAIMSVAKMMTSTFSKLVTTKSAKKYASTAAAILSVGLAMLLIADAMAIIALLPADKLLIAILTVGILFKMLSQELIQMQKLKGSIPGGIAGIIAVAFAIQILANSIAVLSLLKPGKLLVATAAIGVLLYLMSKLLMDVDRNADLDSGAMLAMAGAIWMIGNAMLVMSGAIAILGALDPKNLAVGMAAVILLIFEISAILAKFAEKSTGQVGSLLAAGAAFLMIAVAIDILAVAIAALAILPMDKLAVSVVAVLVLIGAIGLALAALGEINPLGVLAAGAAMLLAAAAMALLIPQLILLGSIKPETLLQGLLGLVGAFAALAVGMVILSFVTPILMAFAVAIGLVGAGVFLAGAGIFYLASGFAILAAAGAAGIAVFMMALTKIMEMLPEFARNAGKALVLFFTGLLEGKEELIQALVELIDVLLQALTQTLPKIVAFIGQLFVIIIPEIITALLLGVTNILKALGDNVDDWCAQILVIIGSLIEGILKGIPMMIERIGQGIIDGCYYLGDVMVEQAPELRKAIIYLAKSMMIALLEFFGGKNKEEATEMVNTGIMLIKSFIKGIGEKVSALTAKIKTMMKEMMQKITDKMQAMKTAGKDLIEKLKTGIKEKIDAVKNGIKEVVQKAIDAVKEFVKDFVQLGKDIIGGLISGITGKKKELDETTAEVAASVEETTAETMEINSPSKKMAKLGAYAAQGLIVGLSSYSEKVSEASEDLADDAINAMQSTLDKLSEDIEDDLSNPVITPVLDLSEIQNGSGLINGMLGRQRMGLAFASDGFNYNTAYARTSEQNMLNTAVNSALAKFVPEIIGAIKNNVMDGNIVVDLTPNSKKFYDEMRVENSIFKRTNGYNGLG